MLVNDHYPYEWRNISLIACLAPSMSLQREYLLKYILPELRQWCEKWKLHLDYIETNDGQEEFIIKHVKGSDSIVLFFAENHSFKPKNKDFFERKTYSLFYTQSNKNLSTNYYENYHDRFFCYSKIVKKEDWRKFGIKVREDIERAIGLLFQERIEVLWQKDKFHFEQHIKKHTRYFNGRKTFLKKLHNYIAKRSLRTFVLYGQEGMGKSALIARFYQDICTNFPCIPIFIGDSLEIYDTSSLLLKLSQQIKTTLGLSCEICISKRPEQIFKELLQQIDQKLVILIDGLEQLEKIGEEFLYCFKSPLPKGVKIVISTTGNFPEFEKLRDIGAEICLLSPLNKQEINKIIAQISFFYKPTKAYLEKLLSKKNIGNPLYLLLSLQQTHKKKIPETLVESFGKLIERLETEYGCSLVEMIFSMIYCSYHGLSNKELDQLLLQMDEEGIQKAILWRIREYLTYRENQLFFSHASLYQAVKQKYMTVEKKKELHSFLAQHFATQISYSQGRIDLRKMEELTWHQSQGDLHRDLLKTLCNIDFLEAWAKTGDIKKLQKIFCEALCTLPENFSTIIAPKVKVNFTTIKLLKQALDKIDLQFLQSHPETFFQTLWNHCYWYDCPQTITLPYRRPNIHAPFIVSSKLYLLAELWRKRKESAKYVWLKALRPLPGRIDSPLIKTLKGHKAPILALKTSPNGDKIVSGSVDKSLRIWDINNGALLHHLETPNVIKNIYFSPKGDKIVTSGGSVYEVISGKFLYALLKHVDNNNIFFGPDNKKIFGAIGRELLVWNAEDGKLQDRVQNNSFIVSIKISPNGKKAFIIFLDNTLQVWTIGKSNFAEHKIPNSLVCFNLDGSKILVRAKENCLQLFCTSSGELLSTLRTKNRIFAMCFAPDGKIVMGDLQGNLHLWSACGDHIKSFTGHNDNICNLCCNMDGKILSQSFDGIIKIWEPEKREICTATFAGNETKAVFSPNSDIVVSASKSNEVCIWDLKNSKYGSEITQNNLYIQNLHIKENKVIAKLTNNDLQVFDINSGKFLYTLSVPETEIRNLVFSLDESKVAAQKDNNLDICEGFTGKYVCSLEGDWNAIEKTVFSPDSSKFMLLTYGKKIRIWETSQGRLLHDFYAHKQKITVAIFDRHSQKIATGSLDATVKIWCLNSGNLLYTLGGHNETITCLCYSNDGTILASGSWDNTIRLWDSNSGALLHTFLGHKQIITDIVFSPDGKKMISCSRDNTVRIWDTQKGKTLYCLKKHKKGVLNLNIAGDGKTIISRSDDQTICVWSLANGKLLFAITDPDKTKNIFSSEGKNTFPLQFMQSNYSKLSTLIYGYSKSSCYSPDRNKLLLISGKSILIWDTKNQKLLSTLKGPNREVTDVSFSFDGKKIASADKGGVIYIWDSSTKKVLHILKGHKGVIESISFHSDHQKLVSAGRDKTVRLWDLQQGTATHILDEHSARVTDVGFSLDNKKIISWCVDQVCIWDVEKGVCLAKREKDLFLEINEISDRFWAHSGETIAREINGKPLAFFPHPILGMTVSPKGIMVGYMGKNVYILKLCGL